MKYNIGYKYERNQQIGVGEAGKGRVFNSFKIVDITSKYICICGIIGSGLFESRKISINDFDSFLKNYNETNAR